MIENHMMQIFDTRELEMRARLSERRVDLVPPFVAMGRACWRCWPAFSVQP